MGYRFVINYLTIPSMVKSGKTLPVESEWENLGVAPPYRNYLMAFKLIPVNRRLKIIEINDPQYNVDLRKWLPGKQQLNLNLQIPASVEPGKYNLAVALKDPYTKEVAVKLGIEGMDAQGWYNLCEVMVE
jgi:hypothetical protein